MKAILETHRLLLREFNRDDAGRFYRLNLNPNIIRYTGNTAFKNVEEATLFLENYQDYKQNGYWRWAVIDKSNDEFLCWCGLKCDKSLDETDIGFRFLKRIGARFMLLKVPRRAWHMDLKSCIWKS